MATISADVTVQMVKWADEQVKKGLYKSRSEVVRELFRDKMCKADYLMLSHSALAEAWENEDDAYWRKFLK